MDTRATIATVFAVQRMIVGIGSWLAPELTLRTFGAPTNTEARLPAVLFGSRDFTLAAALLKTANNPEQRRAAATAGVLCDTLDTIATLREYGTGRLPAKAAILAGGGAAYFALLGAYLLTESTTNP